MENAIEDGGAEEIERLANEVGEQASSIIQSDSPVEAENDSGHDSGNEPDRDTACCKEVLALVLKHYNQSVHNEIYGKLETIAGSAIAERIAERAPMSEAVQGSLAEHLALVLKKYGVAQWAQSEVVVISLLATHFFQLRGVRNDVAELVAKANEVSK